MKRSPVDNFDRASAGWEGCAIGMGLLVVARLIADVIHPGWLESLVGWQRELPIMILAIMASAAGGWLVGTRRWERKHAK